jgi:hypothetical protein
VIDMRSHLQTREERTDDVAHEFSAYLTVQKLVESRACNALPDAPVEAIDWRQETALIEADQGRQNLIRHWLSVEFRRLADRLEPAPHYLPSTATGRRNAR